MWDVFEVDNRLQGKSTLDDLAPKYYRQIESNFERVR